MAYVKRGIFLLDCVRCYPIMIEQELNFIMWLIYFVSVLRMLAEKLNMTADDAERWIVNLIRNARLDAKIDSQQGHVVMATQTVSPYQQLIEKTKMLSVRSQKLAADIEKKLNARNADVSQFLFSFFRRRSKLTT